MANKKTFEVALLLTANDKASQIISNATAKAQARISAMSQLGNKAFGVGLGAGAVGVGITAGLSTFVKAAEESEIAGKRLEHTFKTMGETDNRAAREAANYASQLQMRIGVEDEEIQMVQSKIATFKKVSDETARMSGVFDRATNAAFDLAAGGFGEASQNAVLLGKALQDPMRGAAALSRTGALNKADVPLIKQIQLTRGLGAAQQYVLKAVERQVKGQAENTATAASKMRVKWAEVSETLGKTLLPQFTKLMSSVGKAADRFNNWASRNPALLSTILKIVVGVGALSLTVSALAFAFGGVFKVISGVMAVMNAYRTLMITMKAAQMAYTFTLLSTGSGFSAVSAGLKAMNLAFLTSPIFLVITAIALAVFLIIKYWEPIKAFFGKLWDNIKIGFSKFWQFVKNWGVLLLGPVGLVIKYWDKIPGWFSLLWGKVKSIFKTFLDFVLLVPRTFLNIGMNIITSIWDGMKSKVSGLFNFVKDVGKKIAGAFKSVLGIASPSKVFMDFGTNITEGASRGIQKGAPGVQAASRGMGASIAPRAGRSSGGGGGMTVNFAPVITGGGNPQDIAAEIKKLFPYFMRELESKMQRKAALSY